MLRRLIVGGVMAGVMLAAPLAVHAQQDPKATIGGGDAGAEAIPVEQILPLTVHEAWVQSGRNEDKFFVMVRELAELSAQKRGLVLPATAEAGQKAGAEIKRRARQDPDQLLYAVVDGAVKTVGTKQTASAK